MTRLHKPVAGSRGYWPKKRAPRIYSSITSYPQVKGFIAFAAYKTGMTQVSFIDNHKGSPTQGKEVFLPATVLAVPNLVVAGIKAYRKTITGSLQDMGTVWAENLSKDLSRKITPSKKRKVQEFDKGDFQFRLIVHTKPREAIGKKTPEIFEVPVQGDWAFVKERLGKEIKASEVFKEGEFIDVRAVTKGKGYQGPVKRFGVKIRIRKATKKRRHIGSLGPRHPARVMPNTVAEAGQLGFQNRTEYNKQILKIGDKGLTPKGGWVNVGELKGDYIILKGSVPGPRKRLIMLRKGIRTHAKHEEKVDIKEIVLNSQQ